MKKLKFECKKCGHTSSYFIKEFPRVSFLTIGLYCGKCGSWQKWLNMDDLTIYNEIEKSIAVKQAVLDVIMTVENGADNIEETLHDLCKKYEIDDYKELPF